MSSTLSGQREVADYYASLLQSIVNEIYYNKMEYYEERFTSDQHLSHNEARAELRIYIAKQLAVALSERIADENLRDCHVLPALQVSFDYPGCIRALGPRRNPLGVVETFTWSINEKLENATIQNAFNSVVNEMNKDITQFLRYCFDTLEQLAA